MADLKTNYVDDVLDTTKNQLRKYQKIQNDDGTVSFVDVTEYTQVGTSFGAKDINDTNAAINDVNGNLNVKYDSESDTIQIYHNGQWHFWKKANLQGLVLFDGNNGGTNTNIITGWTNKGSQYGTSFTVTSSSITLKGSGNNTSGTIQPVGRSNNTVSLDNYTKMIVEVLSPGIGQIGFGKLDTWYTDAVLVSLNQGEVELDISTLTGGYYLWLRGAVNFSGETRITKITLV